MLTLGGKRVYVAGDTEDNAEMRALRGIDVAFLPMNLPYTMSVEKAAEAIREFKPNVVYPYHYRSHDGTKVSDNACVAAKCSVAARASSTARASPGSRATRAS